MGSPINWSSEYQFEAVQVSLDTKTSTRVFTDWKGKSSEAQSNTVYTFVSKSLSHCKHIDTRVKQPRDRDEISVPSTTLPLQLQYIYFSYYNATRNSFLIYT